jgi:hypothetical protein
MQPAQILNKIFFFFEVASKPEFAVCSPVMRKFYKPPLAALPIVLSHKHENCFSLFSLVQLAD